MRREIVPRPQSVGGAAARCAALVAAARPAQWVKNLVLPLPFLFGGALGTGRGWVLAAAGFAIFCLITSGVYIVNDVMDRERDRAHPEKKHRPLASGRLAVSTAVGGGGRFRDRRASGGLRPAQGVRPLVRWPTRP